MQKESAQEVNPAHRPQLIRKQYFNGQRLRSNCGLKWITRGLRIIVTLCRVVMMERGFYSKGKRLHLFLLIFLDTFHLHFTIALILTSVKFCNYLKCAVQLPCWEY